VLVTISMHSYGIAMKQGRHFATGKARFEIGVGLWEIYSSLVQGREQPPVWQ
jgi:hypothetical protein